MKKRALAFILSIALIFTAGCSSESGGGAGTSEKITGFDTAVEAAYDYAGEFYEGFAKVGRLNADGNMKYFFINTKGEVISAEYDYADDFSDGMAVVANMQTVDYNDIYTYGYINTKGEEAIPLQFKLQGESKCYSFYNGYAVVEEVGDEHSYGNVGYGALTYLIDKHGNKVDNTVEIHEIGYGGYGMEDPRVLSLETTYSNYDRYIGWSDLQYARIYNKFPVAIYDPVQKKTIEIDKDLKAVGESDGKLLNNWDKVTFVDYNYLNDEGNKVLLDDKGNVLTDDVYWAYEISDGVILADGDLDSLYTTDGEMLVEDCESITSRENGFILEIVKGEFIVVDKTMETLWQTNAEALTQEKPFGYWDEESGRYKQMYSPLMSKRVYFGDNDGCQYLSPESGRLIIDYDQSKRPVLASKDFYALNDAVYGANDPQQCVELVDVKTGARYVMDGIYNMNMYSKDTVSYSTTADNYGERTIAKLVSNSGVPMLEPVENNEVNDENSPYELAKDNTYSIWGIEGENGPVTLKKGDETIGQYTATSLIYNGIRKEGATYDYNKWEVTDIYIVNEAGEKISETYEDMGRINESYISFKQGGKWGYLKAN